MRGVSVRGGKPLDGFKIRAVIWNVQGSSKKVDVDLLVDTGSTHTVLPRSILDRLGTVSVRTARLRLADDRVVEKPLGEIGIEIDGFKATATPVIFGEEDILLLGSVTMEQLGLALDPVERRFMSAIV